MKQMIGVDVGGYTFDASTKTITITGLDALDLEQILVITNVTDNIIIYSFNDPLLGGVIASNVLTLTYDTSTMGNADELQIWVEYKTIDGNISGIPKEYSNSIISSRTHVIRTKGITNKFKHHVSGITENMEGSTDLVSALDGTNTDLLQIFKSQCR